MAIPILTAACIWLFGFALGAYSQRVDNTFNGAVNTVNTVNTVDPIHPPAYTEKEKPMEKSTEKPATDPLLV